jgi:glycosyltransferase involved in cell wall biosynthesis
LRSLYTLHVCYSFPPDAPGGTEVYVDALCRALIARNVEASVAAPAFCDAAYESHGLRVRRFAADQSLGLDALYAGDPLAAASFAKVLDAEGPDLVHLHALTPACSPLLAQEVTRRGLPLVFTPHTPTATCQRGTMLEFGKRACDGRLEIQRCSACALDARGAGLLSRVAAAMPVKGGHFLAYLGKRGGAWTALRMSSLLSLREESLQQLFQAADRIVVLAPWVESVLLANRVPVDKLVRSPHGIDGPLRRARKQRTADEPLRVAHLGRLDPAKGTALLIGAMRATRSVGVRLDIYGIDQHDSGAQLDLIRMSAGDPRVHWEAPIPSSDVVERLSNYDIVAVPSQGLETGPLVVLEAFAAGVPVLGSALPGIADKVNVNVDGLLVEPFDSEEAWASALEGLATNRELLARLRAGVRPPRSIADVADEMCQVYESLAGSRRREAAPKPADCLIPAGVRQA